MKNLKSYVLSNLTLTLLLIFVFASCELPQRQVNNQADYGKLAEDAALVDYLSNDLYKLTENQSRNGEHSDVLGKEGSNGFNGDCAEVTLDLNGGNWPKTLTINFPDDGCTELTTGVHRKGKVIIVYTGRYISKGTVVEVTPVEYYVNGYKIEGQKRITNKGRNGANQLEFLVEDENGAIIKPDGSKITWESERLNTWLEGEETLLNFCDDSYSIDGYVSGEISDGSTYRLETVEPLIAQICCKSLVGGKLSFSYNGTELGTIDYGEGECDSQATLEWDGNVSVIIIP